MNESEIVKELARRAAMPEETAGACVKAMKELVGDGSIDGASLMKVLEPPAAPDDPGVVDRLIARAKKHPLGLEFLTSGFLATVAITLGAHAFTVEAARRRLQREQQAKENNPA
jgi:hypothetical protein